MGGQVKAVGLSLGGLWWALSKKCPELPITSVIKRHRMGIMIADLIYAEIFYSGPKWWTKRHYFLRAAAGRKC